MDQVAWGSERVDCNWSTMGEGPKCRVYMEKGGGPT